MSYGQCITAPGGLLRNAAAGAVTRAGSEKCLEQGNASYSELSGAMSLGPHSAHWQIVAALQGTEISARNVSFLRISAPPKKAQLPGQCSLVFI